MKDKIYVNLATIPERVDALKMVIEGLYGQSNAINVYLNGFNEVPDFLDKPGINIARSQDHGDRGDAGKFFWSDKVEGYYLTVDDDIIYPKGYVKHIIAGIDARDKKVPVGLHGELFKDEINHWTRDRRGTYHFINYLAKDSPACVLGTGCMGYHTSGIKVKPEDFEIPNMADVWFTRICKSQNKPRIVLAHRQNWLRIIPMKTEATLWGKTVDEERSKPDVKSKEVRGIQPCLPWNDLYDTI